MSDLAEFLLARIGEDEAAARAAGGAAWVAFEEEFGTFHVGRPAEGVWHWPYLEEDRARHIARHNPARILAECEAKRRLVDSTNARRHEVVDGDCWYTCAAATEERDGGTTCDDSRHGNPCDCGRDRSVAYDLCLLALPYADHPDYRAEWSV